MSKIVDTAILENIIETARNRKKGALMPSKIDNETWGRIVYQTEKWISEKTDTPTSPRYMKFASEHLHIVVAELISTYLALHKIYEMKNEGKKIRNATLHPKGGTNLNLGNGNGHSRTDSEGRH